MPDDEEKEEEKEKGKKKKKKNVEKGGNTLVLILILVIIILLLVIGGGAAYFMFLSGPQTGPQTVLEEEQPTEEVTGGETDEAPSEAEKLSPEELELKKMQESMEAVGSYEMGSLVMNLYGEDAARYLKVSMTLDYNTEKMAEELEKKHAKIKDVIISTCSAKTYQEVADRRGKNVLKAELIHKINRFLTTGKIIEIYFTSFVIQ